MKKLYRGEPRGSIAFPSQSWYVRTGEFRCPKKGEYYLSGAIPHAYRAYNDLTTEYYIMTPAPTPAETITTADGLTYRLSYQ